MASLSGDHPRSRGEYLLPLPGLKANPGSSPLSRGIPAQAGGLVRDSGIIPALAGNTRCIDGGCFRGSDHPRSRGEYWSTGRAASNVLGSSPLSRGILGSVTVELAGEGIIPALAGNTR